MLANKMTDIFGTFAPYVYAVLGSLAIEVATLFRELHADDGRLPRRYRTWSYPVFRIMFALVVSGPLAILLDANSFFNAFFVGITAPFVFDTAARALPRDPPENRNKQVIFINLVGRSIIFRRVMQVGGMSAFAGLLLLFGIRSWILTVPIFCLICDIVLVRYRVSKRLYGNNDLEFAEAVRYVIARKASGGGPPEFDRTFTEPRPEQDLEASAEPEPAR